MPHLWNVFYLYESNLGHQNTNTCELSVPQRKTGMHMWVHSLNCAKQKIIIISRDML